jgi:subtilisin family serine protease
MGIASTSNLDVLSIFSSYGRGVFLAAPGEGVVTTWPGQNYAEATGTSFSSPLVAGTASLALRVFSSITVETMRSAMGRGKYLKSHWHRTWPARCIPGPAKNGGMRLRRVIRDPACPRGR